MQKLELTWIGKGEQINPEPRILIEKPEHAYGNGDKGMLIHGDNLLALMSLQSEYAGQVKCIYIDPPYNTGSAFEHYDDNVEHSTWLNLMKPRLELLRQLLTEDGSVWISIDDDEMAYMKVLCDEVFGRSNYMATILWQKRTSPDVRLAISNAHDYILVYAKSWALFREVINKLPLSEEQTKNYKNPDNDPRGLWTSTDCTAQAGHATKDQFYTLTTPSGRVIELPSDRCWRFTKPRMEEQIADNRIWFGMKGDGVPRKKTFLSENKGVSAWSWWTNKEVGHNQEAKKEVLQFNSADVFSTPKPERLIQRILTLATNKGDIVLDSFLGSGTTAAVAHKMGRRWIGIELGDHAYTHCLPRMKAVVDGEQGGISKAVDWKGGGGFKVYELAPSLLEKSKRGNMIISNKYNDEMLQAAMAKHEGYTFAPVDDPFWKQGYSGENNFIFTTTGYISPEYLDNIATGLGADEYLLVCAESFEAECVKRHKNITVRPIPRMLLGRCEWGKDNYDLNVIMDEITDWEDDDE
jgi:adenine-specific DNA-methyltransferase